LESAVDPVDYKLNLLLSQDSAQSVAGQQRAIDAVLGILALAPDNPGEAGQLRRQAITTRIASRLRLDHKTVWNRFWELRNKRKKEATRAVPDRTVANSPTSRDAAELEPPLERQLLTMLLAEPAFVPDAAREVTPEDFTHPGARRLLNGLYQLQAGGQPADIDGLRTLIHDPALIARALKLHDIGRSQPDRPRWFQVILKKFREERAKPQKQQIREQLTAASDHDQAVELLRKLQNPTEGSGT
jgi:DNA primase